MKYYQYGDFPTMDEIKQDYAELMEIIKDVRTIEQARELEKQGFIIEINGISIDEFVAVGGNGYVCTDKDIEWIRYESYGCLSYIYNQLNIDQKIWFDVWSEYCFDEFIRDITIDKLTVELYEEEKNYALALMGE